MRRLTDGEQNIGLIARVLCLPLADVTDTSEPDLEDNNRVDASDITLESGIGGWDYFGFTFETGTVREESKDTDNGTLYTYTIEGRLAKNSNDRRNDFERYDNEELIVIAADANNDVLLLGSCSNGEKTGMKMTTSFASGPETKSKNAHQVTLKYETFRRAFHLKNEDLLTVLL